MIRFASLGSGSAGNALLVESGATCLMVDCGFGQRETIRRLARLGRLPEQINGILVTHEHGDHVGGVFPFARRNKIPVWLSYGTFAACETAAAGVDVRIIDGHAAFGVGALEIQPYPVPHDAREPLQFVFASGKRRLGLLTDAGEITRHIRDMLSGIDGLVLECNHDADMLAQSRYPDHLKRRIAGPFGHLDNGAAAELLAQVDAQRIKHVVAAHLSQENNLPSLAQAALAEVLGCAPDWIGVADQDLGCGWRQLF